MLYLSWKNQARGEDALRRNEVDMPLLPPMIQQSSGAQDVPASELMAVVDYGAGSPATLPKVPGVKQMGRKRSLLVAHGKARLPLGVHPSGSASDLGPGLERSLPPSKTAKPLPLLLGVQSSACSHVLGVQLSMIASAST